MTTLIPAANQNPNPHLASLLINLHTLSLLSSTITTGIYIGSFVPLSSERNAALLTSLSTLQPLTVELAVLKSLSPRKDARAMINLVCCLGAGFDEEYAVSVLDILAGRLKGEFRPEWRVRRGQWARLLRVCGSVFDERVFKGNVAGVLERGLIDKKAAMVLPLKVAETEMKSARTLATVLVEKGKVLNGKRKAVHVTSVDQCGWIAVWAEEVLVLRVEIYDQEGDLIRRSFEDNEGKVQVTVRFVKVQGLSTSMLSVVTED